MMVLSTNLKTKATTQFTNFDFDSVVNFKDSILLAGASGLFQYTGETDNGTDVIGYFEITTDFGIKQDKRIRFVYMTFEASSDLILTVTTDRSHTEAYTVSVDSSGQHSARIAISRALYGRFFTFQVKNSPDDESEDFSNDFSIDKISVLPIVRSHGFNGN